MRINNNLLAMNTHRQLGIANNSGAKSMEKLSSGSRINRAADDAAGLSISEKMRGQIRGLTQASRNAQDGISLIQTAEGAMNEVSGMLVRMKELAVQRANGTYNADDQAQIDLELKELGTEIDNIIDNTKFNDTVVSSNSFAIIISDNGTSAITIAAATTTDTKIATAAAIADGSTATVTLIEDAIKEINTARSTYGAQQNRLESVVRNLDNTTENLQAAESRIRDTDMAKEMMEQTKNNILQQASTAMLAQANSAPQTVLQLLR